MTNLVPGFKFNCFNPLIALSLEVFAETTNVQHTIEIQIINNFFITTSLDYK